MLGNTQNAAVMMVFGAYLGDEKIGFSLLVRCGQVEEEVCCFFGGFGVF